MSTGCRARCLRICASARSGYPRAERNSVGGYNLYATYGNVGVGGWGRNVWFDLDDHLRHMDATGHEIDFICSLGPFGTFFSEIPLADGVYYSQMYNDEMAAAQRKHAGRVWASGVVPLQDTKAAIDELDRMVNKLGLIGVNIPGSHRQGQQDRSSPTRTFL